MHSDPATDRMKSSLPVLLSALFGEESAMMHELTARR
jgi:hypothetical protein